LALRLLLSASLPFSVAEDFPSAGGFFDCSVSAAWVMD